MRDRLLNQTSCYQLKEETPMSLLALQEEFKRYIQTQDSSITEYLIDKNKDSLQERLAVYGEGYWLRLWDALRTNYPNLYRYLGDDLFDSMTTRYMAAFPPIDTVIRYYGDHFVDFLRNEYPDRPCIAELAIIEWEMGLALDSSDSSLLALTDLATLAPEAWETLTFKLHASVRLIELSTNAFDILNALQLQGGSMPQERTLDVPQFLLISRQKVKPILQTLTTEQRWLYEAVAAGTSFGELCAGLCEWFSEEDASTYAANTLFAWVNQGLFQA